MPEVDEQTLAVLQRSHEVLMQLNNDPRTRAPLESALKVHYPQVTTEEEQRQTLIQPALDAFKKDVVEPLQAQLQTFTETRQQEDQRRTEDNLNGAFQEFRTKRGFTDEGIEAVKQLMVDRSIADPYAAAALFAEQNPPPPEPTTGFAPQHWNLDQTATDFDVKGLFENEDRWADQMVSKTLNEIRVGQAA